MRAKEFISEAEDALKKKLGRTFNHLEDLVFFHGSQGTLEALSHLEEINQDSSSVRMKWDGCIHKDTVLKTNQGDLTIEQVIELYSIDPKLISVFGKDLDTLTDLPVDILGTSITHGIKPWLELTLENGSTIKLTEDHRVYTSNRGWVEAGNLTTTDDIVEILKSITAQLPIIGVPCNRHMKIVRTTKLEEKYMQYDITTATENFYVKAGDRYILIHNSPQVYWGRDETGTFVLAGHNGWARGAKSTSPEEVYDFIANKSGAPKTPIEKQERDQFAKEFANLYPLFESATPEKFRGYVYADALFLNKSPPDTNGVYNFSPNTKSKTGYHVAKTTELGHRISQAKVMVVGHATFDQFGADDSAQKPKDDFSEFNSNPQLIVLGPYYTQVQPQIDTSEVAAIKQYIVKYAGEVDAFLEPLQGVAGLKDIIYRYVNTMAKQKQLATIGTNFIEWVKTSGVVSPPQQVKILDRAGQHPNALPVIFEIMTRIMQLKDSIIDQLDQAPGEIIASNSEGWVRYAGANKKLGNVKFVPRHRWTP